MSRIWVLLIVFLLPACSTGIPVDKYNKDAGGREAFKLCHGYSCTYKSDAGFTKAEWQKIENLFGHPAAKSAEQERSKIAGAIAMMEGISGIKTGTSEDNGEAARMKTSTKQLDCIDETVNTTHYLEFLHEAGLLKFHEPALPTHRGYFIDGRWPHNTAVMKEKESGELYVVDSFYRANGEQPYIVPRKDWLAGWRPPGATQ